MKASIEAINLIKASESLHKLRKDGQVEAYPDPAHGWKVPTIGWGTTGKDVKQGTVWPVSVCENRLLKHIDEICLDLDKVLSYKGGYTKTSQSQFDAFVDFVYNLGIGNFKSSTLLKMHKAGEYEKAALQFLRWDKANGKPLKGLSIRRAKEMALYVRK